MSEHLLGQQCSGFTEKQVDQLMHRLFRILRGCNISAELLAASAAKALDSEEPACKAESVWASPEQHLACTELVFAWRRNAAFVDDLGNPRRLSVLGSQPSFESLCQQVVPGYRADSLLSYLEALGAVRPSGGGEVELLTESVLACRLNTSRTIAPDTVLMHLQGFLGSVEFNLFRPLGDQPSRFERACYSSIPRSLLPIFERLVEARGQNFVDSIDEWLVRHRTRAEVDEETCRVGAGAYTLVHGPTDLQR